MRPVPLVLPAALLCAAGLALSLLGHFQVGPDWLASWPVWLFPALFAAACLAAPLFPRLAWYAPVLCHHRRATGCVALTFDDGPSPETTPLLLDLLAASGAKATFFAVGKRAMQHPELVRSLLAAGHEVANHTLSHDVLLAFRSTRTVREEITGCTRVLAGLGVATPYLRPPVGIINPRIARVARQEGLTLVNWSLRTGDRGNRKTVGMGEQLARQIRGGDIVLLHDRPPSDQSVEAWLADIRQLIAGPSNPPLKFVTLSELIQEERG